MGVSSGFPLEAVLSELYILILHLEPQLVPSLAWVAWVGIPKAFSATCWMLDAHPWVFVLKRDLAKLSEHQSKAKTFSIYNLLYNIYSGTTHPNSISSLH